MKIIKPIGILFTICWISVLIESLLPFAFPASFIGLLLLLFCLLTKILKIEHVKEPANFLLANMSFLFVPAGVNIINYLDILKANWFALLVICVVTTVITFAVTAYTIKLTMWLLHGKRRTDS